MIVHDITVSFHIFSVLTYDRIFRKNLEHDTYGVNKVFDPALCRSQYQAYSLELMLIFYFMTPLGGYSNIFETET